MKKILTLVFAVASFAAVQAQTSKDEARKVVLGQPKNTGQTPAPTRNGRDVVLGGDNNENNYPNNPNTYPNDRNSTKEVQINQVNREYDAKIASIRNNGYLSQAEKERMIRQLEKDRAKRIQEINSRYYKNGTSKKSKVKSKKNDDDDDDSKHDNGNHYGWEKGKGNKGKNKHD